MTCRCGLPSFGYSACYSCLKSRHLDGGSLTETERAFAWSAPTRPNRDGWYSPGFEPFGPEEELEVMTDEEQRLLRMLSDPSSSGRPAEEPSV